MRLLRKIFGGISLTAAMFVFQACYGTDPYFDYTEVTFRVVEDKDHQPLEGIRVMSQRQSNSDFVYDWVSRGATDSSGLASVNIETVLDQKFRFIDSDSVYAVKDTILDYYSFDTVDIVLTRLPNAK